MHRIASILMFFVLLLLSNGAGATVAYLSKNNVTKQLHVFETGRIIEYDGLFWEVVAGEQYAWTVEERKLRLQGYTDTDFPYLLDVIALAALLTFSMVTVVLRKRKRGMVVKG